MLDKILLLLGPAADSQDELISLLINNAKAYLLLYCGLDEYSTDYDTIIIRMVIEDWNKLGSEGVSSKSFSGLTETFSTTGYSALVTNLLDQCAATAGGRAKRIVLL